eukprot:5658247-Pyramimonas_sp.AAC.1
MWRNGRGTAVAADVTPIVENGGSELSSRALGHQLGCTMIFHGSCCATRLKLAASVAAGMIRSVVQSCIHGLREVFSVLCSAFLCCFLRYRFSPLFMQVFAIVPDAKYIYTSDGDTQHCALKYEYDDVGAISTKPN